MESEKNMRWQSFKELLFRNPELDLQFQYGNNERVAASYHITEVKQAPITSVDCGGAVNKWTEVIVQLWEPADQQQERAMKVGKALSIFDLVETKLNLESTGIVKIEFGNSKFETRQMYPDNFIVENDSLIVNLIADHTQCKALGRGDSCGTSTSDEACCEPAKKPTSTLKVLRVTSECCTPASGCC